MNEFVNCEECVDLLTDYLEGNLEDDTHQKLARHFAACAPCVNFLKTFEKSSDLTHQLQNQNVEVPEEVQNRVKSFLKEELMALDHDEDL